MEAVLVRKQKVLLKILGNTYEPRTLDRSSDWIAAHGFVVAPSSNTAQGTRRVTGAVHEGPRKDIVP